ncbi:MAG TPA: hypothetical protein P5044_06440, partial [bacterium]|nr:hypothetical protein [bacterium]
KDSVEVIDYDLSDDLSDEVLAESDETVDDDLSDEVLTEADKDTLMDEDIETPDYDYPAGTDGDPDCPSLLNAGFPYKDNDGKLTFCRKCDLPAPANDQQCVRNLWEMNNRRIVEEYPNKYCYPLPCDVTEKAIKNDSSILGNCDFDAESKIYHGSTGIFKQGDIWEGKIGMYATAGEEVDGKYIVKGCLLYEIDTEKYTMVSYASERMAYNQDRFLFVAGNTYDYKGYILSAKKVESGWKYEVAYDDGVYRSNFLYPPAVGKNYVIINIQKVDETGPQEVLYASVNDWQWKKLGEGLIYYPHILDDIAFFNYNNAIWACDLAKLPTDIATGCKKVSRDGEKASAPFPKRGNSSLVAYIGGSGLNKFTIADLSKDPIEYTDLNIQPLSPDLISYTSGQWDGDIIAFSELYQFSQVDVDYRMCYYSISKDKKVCFPNPSPYGNRMGYIFGGVEGKYITYQPTGALVLKDMECYCKEYPDQCLYDEYMPEEAPVYVY